MNNVFFNNGTLTSTEANYLCAIAQESIRKITERLSNLQFYKTEISAIGSNIRQLTSVGIESLDFIESDIEKIAAMNSLTAWLREAIKEKDTELRRILDLSLEEFLKMRNIEYPKLPKSPESWIGTTEEEIVNTWDINKKNKYYMLEAKASTYGKVIHINKPFSNARKVLQQVVNFPILKEGTGRDTILIYQTPTVSPEDVDNKFFELETKYRSYEKELNKMKAEIKEAINTADLNKAFKYNQELDDYQKAYNTYNSQLGELRNMCQEWKTQTKEKISKLKIAIPTELRDIYQEVCKLS